jgi:hypothetical protein
MGNCCGSGAVLPLTHASAEAINKEPDVRPPAEQTYDAAAVDVRAAAEARSTDLEAHLKVLAQQLDKDGAPVAAQQQQQQQQQLAVPSEPAQPAQSSQLAPIGAPGDVQLPLQPQEPQQQELSPLLEAHVPPAAVAAAAAAAATAAALEELPVQPVVVQPAPRRPQPPAMDITLVVVGLDNAGKSTVVNNIIGCAFASAMRAP